MNNRKTVSVKIASDVVCPWCYIGKKELEIAMEQLKDEFHFEVQYLPFQLSPEIPEEGISFKEHITKKFGDWNQFLQRSQFVVERGKTVGINFNFANTVSAPNTFNIHRLIQFSHQFGLQSELKEAFMKANFEELIDLTKKENIIDIAVKNGLDEELVIRLLDGDEGEKEIKMIQESMRAMGITGVPFFILNDQYGLSGAVPSSQLVQAIREASAHTA